MTTNVERYRHLLLARRASLLASLTSSDAGVAEPRPTDDGDWAPILHDRFIFAQVKDLDFKTLRLIDLALARLESGEYGVCADCGRDVPTKRLNAVPWATRCVACQERFAERDSGAGDAATAA